MRIRPVGAELFHADGQTNLTVAFHYYANAPKHSFPILRSMLLSCEKLVQQRRAGTVSVICIIIPLYTGYLQLYTFLVAQQAQWALGLIVEASRSHSDTPYSVGLLWADDQPAS